ncbi:hypothetical protein MNEG_5190, partial [Monoraphidium neglectum]
VAELTSPPLLDDGPVVATAAARSLPSTSESGQPQAHSLHPVKLSPQKQSGPAAADTAPPPPLVVAPSLPQVAAGRLAVGQDQQAEGTTERIEQQDHNEQHQQQQQQQQPAAAKPLKKRRLADIAAKQLGRQL